MFVEKSGTRCPRSEKFCAFKNAIVLGGEPREQGLATAGHKLHWRTGAADGIIFTGAS